MDNDSNRQLVLRFFEDCWNRGNVALLDELLAPDHVHHLPGWTLHGPVQVRGLILNTRGAISDFHITLDDVIAARDKLICRWTIQGVNTGSLMSKPPTGKPIAYTGIDIMRCAGGRMVELWGQYDSRGLERQLTQP